MSSSSFDDGPAPYSECKLVFQFLIADTYLALFFSPVRPKVFHCAGLIP